MGATHFLMKTLPRVATQHVLYLGCGVVRSDCRNRVLPFATDSPLEEGVRSEPVSVWRDYSGAILERNRVVLGLKIARIVSLGSSRLAG
jgi:hypothetical protein